MKWKVSLYVYIFLLWVLLAVDIETVMFLTYYPLFNYITACAHVTLGSGCFVVCPSTDPDSLRLLGYSPPLIVRAAWFTTKLILVVRSWPGTDHLFVCSKIKSAKKIILHCHSVIWNSPRKFEIFWWRFWRERWRWLFTLSERWSILLGVWTDWMIPMANDDYMENMMRFHLNPGESVIVICQTKKIRWLEHPQPYIYSNQSLICIMRIDATNLVMTLVTTLVTLKSFKFYCSAMVLL